MILIDCYSNEVIYEHLESITKLIFSILFNTFVLKRILIFNPRLFITSTIIGATTLDQLKEDIESVNVKLDKKVVEKIEQVHKQNPNPSP